MKKFLFLLSLLISFASLSQNAATFPDYTGTDSTTKFLVWPPDQQQGTGTLKWWDGRNVKVNSIYLQGRHVSKKAPVNGEGLKYNSSTNEWEPGAVSGAGGGGEITDINGLQPALDAKSDKAITKTIASNGTTTITFDKQFYGSVVQTGNISLTSASTGNVNFVDGLIIVDGNSSSSLTFPSNWVNGNLATFDNTKRNRIYLQYSNNEVVYNIIKSSIPDAIAPVLSSATTNTAGDKIILSYNEGINTSSIPATSSYTLSGGKTVTSISILGSTVTLNLSSPYVVGNVITLSYTAGASPIRDFYGNNAANLSNQSVTNSVASYASTKSFAEPSSANYVLKTNTNPTGVYFSNGTTDNPFSVSGWIKVLTGVGTEIVFSVGDATHYTAMVTGGKLRMILKDPSDNTLAVESNTLTLNTWLHYIIKYDGSKTAAGIKVLINNVDQSNIFSTATFSGMPASVASYRFSIGGFNNGNFYASHIRFDDIAVFNANLSGSQCTELYSSGSVKDLSTLSYSANLRSWWKFEDNGNDSGPNALHLSSTNAVTYSTDHP